MSAFHVLYQNVGKVASIVLSWPLNMKSLDTSLYFEEVDRGTLIRLQFTRDWNKF